MRTVLAMIVIVLVLSSEAQAQFGGILPRLPTGTGLYATVPFQTNVSNGQPLGYFRGTMYGPVFIQGNAQGLYVGQSDIDAAAMKRANLMRQPSPKYATLWRPKPKPKVSPVQALLDRHLIR